MHALRIEDWYAIGSIVAVFIVMAAFVARQ